MNVTIKRVLTSTIRGILTMLWIGTTVIPFYTVYILMHFGGDRDNADKLLSKWVKLFTVKEFKEIEDAE